MRNLNPLFRKIGYWDSIVSTKNLLDRSTLRSIRPTILSTFSEYSSNVNIRQLQLISPSSLLYPHKELLQDCYSVKSIGLTKLKKAIKDKQDVMLKGECQYCNIGEPTTFDHYLPKARFPEFAALSINLMPCCFQCNLDKGDKWLSGSNRRFINFYYDELPVVNYLKCKILFKNGIPIAKFKIDVRMVDSCLQKTILSHYTELKLIKRYQERSGSEIGYVLTAIAHNAKPNRRAKVIKDLILQAKDIKAQKGNNYWRAIIIETLANSEKFLVYARY
jgi:5-methylcytosine-specific restriction endonuclease McrA